MCEHFESEKRQEANFASYTDARGWAMLYNGFSGEGAKPMSPADLLPFPEELRASQKDDEPRKVSEATEKIARALLKSEKLPPNIVAQIEPIL